MNLTEILWAKGKTSGPYTEFQVASDSDTGGRLDFQHWRPDSVFLGLEGMTLLYRPFERAHPGFDLYMPRLFTVEQLRTLKTGLLSHEKEWLGLETLASAQEKWGKFSVLVRGLRTDAQWRLVRTRLAETIDHLVAYLEPLIAGGKRLWVLGP